MKRFKADPYDVAVLDPKGNEADFAQVLSVIEKMSMEAGASPADSRWCAYGTSEIVMDNLRKGPPIIGTVFMARNVDLQSVGGRSGISPPKLAEDEGMGKHIAFLWDKERQTLWVQRDRNSVGMTAFKDYLSNRSGHSITITPRIHSDAVARLKKLKYIKRIDLTIGSRTEGSHAQVKGSETLQTLVGLPEELDAGSVEVIIKASRRKFLGSGSHGLLQETAKLFREGFDELRGAKVLGVNKLEDDNEADWQSVDLLRDKMHFESDINPDRFRDPKTLMVAMKRLWDDRRDDA